MSASAYEEERKRLLALFRAALGAVAPGVVVPPHLPKRVTGRLAVVAIGKAAGEMMRAALAHLPAPTAGLVVTRYGHLGAALPAHIEVIEAGHPVPDASSVRAAERALLLASTLTSADHLLALLSGGGSALCAAPAQGVTLADKQATTRALLASGATITEINCVRKHLSRFKGGRLALAAGGAAITTLVISDVPGDDPSFVASGPTVQDRTTLADARAVISKYNIAASEAVIAALNDPANESPPSVSAAFGNSATIVVARARDALDAAAQRARELQYTVVDLGDALQTEARTLGAEHAVLARRWSESGASHAILSGGETTVTVRNPRGRGGRNLEYLLGLAIALDGAEGVSALACDTDGLDGTEDAAGAMIFPDTLARARSLGLDAQAHLRENDSYTFFQRLGDLVITGATLTNVNDFRILLTRRS